MKKNGINKHDIKSRNAYEVAIGGIQLIHLGIELVEWGLDSARGIQTPQWKLDDIKGAWENTKAIGSMLKTIGLGLQGATNPWLLAVSPYHREALKESFDMGAGIVNTVVTDIKTGNTYAIGGYVFDVASMFVGVGEVNAALKGTKLAGKITEGLNAFKATTLGKLGKATTMVDKALKYGDDAAKAFATKLKNMPMPFMDEFAFAGQGMGKTTLGDYMKAFSKGDGFADDMAKKASGASGFNINEIRPKLKTDPDTAFFWSGRTDGVGGADIAANVAKSKGGTTLESTIANKNIKMPEWDFNNPSSMEAWDLASGAYAEQVSGRVRAVVGSELRPGNIWENVELPRLKSNPKVTKITTIDPRTGIEKIIFERK